MNCLAEPIHWVRRPITSQHALYKLIIWASTGLKTYSNEFLFAHQYLSTSPAGPDPDMWDKYVLCAHLYKNIVNSYVHSAGSGLPGLSDWQPEDSFKLITSYLWLSVIVWLDRIYQDCCFRIKGTVIIDRKWCHVLLQYMNVFWI